MRRFIEDLAQRGELGVVRRPVNPRHQLAAVTKAVQKAGEQAVLFEKVEGTALPVVSNLYGSHDRLCRLIGAGDGKTFCQRWIELTDACIAAQDDDVLEQAPASVQSEFVAGQLSDLPAVTYHARDAGPYFTSAIFLAREPDSGVPNLSFHRAMQVSDEELRVRLGSTHDLARYQAKAEQRGQPLEAALLLSCPPDIFLAACASLPYEASELAMAAKISGGKLAMRRCETIDLDVPASVDIVVEGRFLPNVKRPEGPFGEFMGNYVGVGDNHVFEVSHVSYRPGAVFHGLVCGSPEDLRPLEAVTAARIYRHVASQMPGVIDVCCRPNVMISIIKIRKTYEGQGKHAILAALGSHLDYNKVVIVVDEDVDIYDLDDVMWAYMTRGRADTRAMILNDIPGFYRDPHKDHWGRLCIDATMPFGREAEFARKTIPGEDAVDLSQWLE
ncbi:MULTISPECIES: UbiD family decarboxylase [unclassified Chelatococcus]|uniref:UbiD family decarboxylase n=1 Tax=unclassified Chelatococcus TaxID=2638111 RepID=UPI001BCF9328|nr:MULTISPECIES: UbiD family decarboxylase [unclassified Chelatococcus]CAH1657843.1 3-polyprenyl-4-hydroxybenzoate carboxy-lyase [Hyphomicrobiales bacterium]MBS7742252.1 UbiD family decarboxylase [Chelatococcus sp. HY11]MBX3542630.1 UbiD family decarboxylase [Chelatococcus sp.]MCO5075154.1 UbiD family decarboxylase [Chelatococcus sp.]CAH1689394.1 3-polyprenyl-4-hydroxybenzoate carboxy-lyase [Hyphomicrobiales bacterium]